MKRRQNHNSLRPSARCFPHLNVKLTLASLSTENIPMDNNYIEDQIKILETRIAETEQLLDDPEMGEMAKVEIEDLKKQKTALENADNGASFEATEQKAGDTLSHRNVIIEVKGAAGGDEAKIWAREFLRMYQR